MPIPARGAQNQALPDTLGRGNLHRGPADYPLLVAVWYGNFAAAMAFAGVLAGAAVVAGLAAALRLALILAFARMLGRGGTATVTFARVLAGATVIPCFTAALAFAVVHAFAGVFVSTFLRCFLRINILSFCASKNSGHGANQQFVEISSLHTHPRIPPKNLNVDDAILRSTLEPLRQPHVLPIVRHVRRHRIAEEWQKVNFVQKRKEHGPSQCLCEVV